MCYISTSLCVGKYHAWQKSPNKTEMYKDNAPPDVHRAGLLACSRRSPAGVLAKGTLGVDVDAPVTTRRFWEEKADAYPLPFEPGTVRRTEPVIEIMERKGLVIDGSRLLDIGCGTGAFALPLAHKGARITALDISGTMLGRLAEEAGRRGIQGVRTHRACWKDLDVRASGLERAFDIVLCGLSVAVESREDIEKMERCSRQWCVHAASGKITRDPRCDRVLRRLGAPLNPRPDIRAIRRRLAAMGRSVTFTSFSAVVDEGRTIDSIVRVLTDRLEAAGKKADRGRIASVVGSEWKETDGAGTIVCRGEVEIGVILWRADEGTR
jgi:SAM-dependent methyltransferase